MTTTQTPAPLPFLLPAANLAVGDTLYSGAVIDVRETAPGGKIHVTLMDGTVLEPMDPGELVEVQRRNAVQALRAGLTELVEKWELYARELLPVASQMGMNGHLVDQARVEGDASRVTSCASDLRALLARLV